MSTVLLIILLLLLVGALPTWPYSSGWGYYPSGGVGLIAHRADLRPDWQNVGLMTSRCGRLDRRELTF